MTEKTEFQTMQKEIITDRIRRLAARDPHAIYLDDVRPTWNDLAAMLDYVDARPAIERIETAAILPDDVVVLHCPDYLTPEQAYYLREQWIRTTELDNHVVVFLAGMRIEIKRPEDIDV